MPVVHVVPTMFGDEGSFGGGERYPLELGRAIAAHRPCRLVGFGRRPQVTRDASGLEVVTLPTAVNLRRHPVHALGPGLWGALADADVVHVHQMRSASARVTALMARARKQPLVVTDHGLGRGGWGGLLPRLFHRFAPVSEYSAHNLQAPRHRTTVLYGGADPERFHPDDREARRDLLFVGRVTPHKGIDGAIRALPDGVKLTIAGTAGHDPDPPHRDYPRLLRYLAAGKDVTFTGRIEEAELPALYRGARALVLPSVERTCYGTKVEISELLGLSALEAMASATPVICSRIGGLPEVVEHGVTGLVVEPGDVVALRAAMERLAFDDAPAASMGAAARERVVERFTWEACAHRCLAIYEELLRTGPE